MKKLFTILASLMLLAENSIGQLNVTNSIPNPGFEHGNHNKPNALGQLNQCDNWKEMNSADWYRETPGHLNSESADPHSGSAFAGFSKSEGVQVQLSNPIKSHEVVTLSFWFNPESTYSFTFNIHLCAQRCPETVGSVGNIFLPDCYEQNGNPSIPLSHSLLHKSYTINDSQSSESFIPGLWYKYEATFLFTAEENADWLIITGNPPGDTYVYVDDFELMSFPPCNHICVGDKGPLKIKTLTNGYLYDESTFSGFSPMPQQLVFIDDILPSENLIDQFSALIKQGNSAQIQSSHVITGAVGNHPQQNFKIKVENALRIRFKVYSSSSQTMHEEEHFDYDGLRDVVNGIEYNDFLIEWNGSTQSGGTLPAGFYNYTVEVWQCDGPEILILAPLYIEVHNPPAQATIITIKNEIIEPCCESYYLIQNRNFNPTSFTRFDANDYIKIGENVDPNQNQGPVNIYADARLDVRAANSIFIENGFNVYPGANFSALLTPCGSKPKQLVSRVLQLRDSNDIIAKLLYFDYNSIEPIVTTSLHRMMTINTIKSNEDSICVYSLDGSLVLAHINHNIIEKDISNMLSTGIYILKKNNGNETVSNLIFIK